MSTLVDVMGLTSLIVCFDFGFIDVPWTDLSKALRSASRGSFRIDRSYLEAKLLETLDPSTAPTPIAYTDAFRRRLATTTSYSVIDDGGRRFLVVRASKRMTFRLPLPFVALDKDLEFTVP